jgi:hypothetical protein
MCKSDLRILTWITLTAAVLSAVWLSAVDVDAGVAPRQPVARPMPASP